MRGELWPSGLNVHLYPSAIRHATRILKITGSLAKAGVFDRIFMIGIADGPEPEREQIDSKRTILRLVVRRKTGGGTAAKALRILAWSRAVWHALQHENVKCINAHSLAVLPLAVLLKSRHGAKLVYDTHELETEVTGSRGMRRYLGKLVERLLIGAADEISVVSSPIANWYRDMYARDRVWVIRNIPERAEIEPARSTLLREAHGIRPEEILFIYQGIIGPGRPIQQLLQVFSDARPDQHVVFMGFGPLVPLVQDWTLRHHNIHLQPAVLPQEIVSYTSGADVGFSVAENLCLSYYLSLPNKLFEYLNAGVPLLVSDFPCFVDVVQRDACGWVAPDVGKGLAALIRSLTADEIKQKRLHAGTARLRYDWTAEEKVLLRMYRSLFSRVESDGPALT